MRTSLAEALDFLPKAILAALQSENIEGGLLEDVETFVVGEDRVKIADIPIVWIIENSVVKTDKSIGSNNTEFLTARYSFFAINQDPDDVEESRRISRDLAVRVGLAIEKQCKNQLLNDERFFDLIDFEELFAISDEINGSSKTVTQSCIVYNFMIRRRRLYCG